MTNKENTFEENINEEKSVKIKIMDIGGVEYKFSHKNTQQLNNKCLLLLSQVKFFIKRFFKRILNYILEYLIQPPINYSLKNIDEQIAGVIFSFFITSGLMFGLTSMLVDIIKSPNDTVWFILYYTSATVISILLLIITVFYILCFIIFIVKLIILIIKFFYRNCKNAITECNDQIPVCEEV